jgi:Pentapeptide repeats (8 copies)
LRIGTNRDRRELIVSSLLISLVGLTFLRWFNRRRDSSNPLSGQSSIYLDHEELSDIGAATSSEISEHEMDLPPKLGRFSQVLANIFLVLVLVQSVQHLLSTLWPSWDDITTSGTGHTWQLLVWAALVLFIGVADWRTVNRANTVNILYARIRLTISLLALLVAVSGLISMAEPLRQYIWDGQRFANLLAATLMAGAIVWWQRYGNTRTASVLWGNTRDPASLPWHFNENLSALIVVPIVLFVVRETKNAWYYDYDLAVGDLVAHLIPVLLDCILLGFVVAWCSHAIFRNSKAKWAFWLTRTSALIGLVIIVSSFLLSHYATYRLNAKNPYYLPSTELSAVVLALLAGGLLVWWRDRHQDGSYGTLGAGILGGALVAMAVFGLQANTEVQRARTTERQNMQTLVMSRQDLIRYDLSEKDLSYFSFARKNLTSSDLSLSDLSYADFSDATLNGAFLNGANLTSSVLRRAKLQGAELGGIRTDRTSFTHADMRNAFICGADLSGATDLDKANLRGAVASASARWPSGFKYRQAGVEISNEACD